MTARARKRIRNGKIVARYHRGETQRQLARAFALSEPAIGRIIKLNGATLPEPERRARAADGIRRKLRDADWLARRNDAVRRAKQVWPDCPPELRDDYETLRSYFPAREARAMVEAAI
jgi:hypothetical protein